MIYWITKQPTDHLSSFEFPESNSIQVLATYVRAEWYRSKIQVMDTNLENVVVRYGMFRARTTHHASEAREGSC